MCSQFCISDESRRWCDQGKLCPGGMPVPLFHPVFCLNTKEMWAGFYSPHRYAQDPIHNDDCIYTPKVIVFKSDTATPAPLPESDWYSVNVITCAAPNLRLLPANGMNPGDGNKTVKMTRAQQQALHEKRLTRILDVAVAGGNEVVILGAFGCGAFENDPEAVQLRFPM